MKTYITFEVTHEQWQEAADIADEIIYAVKNFFDVDEAPTLEIQSISDTIPTPHGREL